MEKVIRQLEKGTILTQEILDGMTYQEITKCYKDVTNGVFKIGMKKPYFAENLLGKEYVYIPIVPKEEKIKPVKVLEDGEELEISQPRISKVDEIYNSRLIVSYNKVLADLQKEITPLKCLYDSSWNKATPKPFEKDEVVKVSKNQDGVPLKFVRVVRKDKSEQILSIRDFRNLNQDDFSILEENEEIRLRKEYVKVQN